MAAKQRKPKARGERLPHLSTPWESDRVKPSSASALDVLMQWLTTPGNALRWRQAKSRKGLCEEVLVALEGQGISGRSLGDVDTKVRVLEKQFVNASAYLSMKGKEEAFQRGEADEGTAKNVLRLCPRYQELATVFGQIPTGREAQVEAAAAARKGAAAIAAVQKTRAADKEAGDKRAAGKWKESLEKNRLRAGSGEKAVERNKGGKERGAGKGATATREKQNTVTSKKRDAGVADRGSVVAGQQNGVGGQRGKVNGKEKGAGADVESEEDEPKTQVHVETEDESSEEEESEDKQVASTKSKKMLKTKTQHGSEESSSDDESSSSREDSESSQEEEDADGEERIPLAQPDEEQDEGETAKRKDKASKDGTSADNEEEESDEEETVEEKEGTGSEEGSGAGGGKTGEEQKEQEAGAAKDSGSSDDSDSSSSQSEDEEEHESEAGSTPKAAVKTDSDHEEPPRDFEKDERVEEAGQKPAEQSDVQPPTCRKRSPGKVPVPRAKRARSDSNVTRDLEREAYIEQAKREQAQRQELFQLERAKLECELEAKRVQLAMEKTLARRTLLGAGVDPAEVDRVLPL